MRSREGKAAQTEQLSILVAWHHSSHPSLQRTRARGSQQDPRIAPSSSFVPQLLEPRREFFEQLSAARLRNSLAADVTERGRELLLKATLYQSDIKHRFIDNLW